RKLSARGLHYLRTIPLTSPLHEYENNQAGHDWYTAFPKHYAILVEPSYPGGPIKLTEYKDLNSVKRLAYHFHVTGLHKLWTPYDSYSDLSRRQPFPPW